MRALVLHRPPPDWPSTDHRTIAQVARTDALRTVPRKLMAIEREELRSLEAKAAAFNPPPGPKSVA